MKTDDRGSRPSESFFEDLARMHDRGIEAADEDCRFMKHLIFRI